MIGINEAIFHSYDYVIGGKLVVGSAVLEENFSKMLNSDVAARERVKMTLAQQMATYMLENNLMEFTQQEDPITSHKTIKVRAYLAPDDQVKVLRLANKVI